MWPPSFEFMFSSFSWIDTFRQDMSDLSTTTYENDNNNNWEWSWWYVLLGLVSMYLMIEIVFAIIVHYIWIPRLNKLEPHPRIRHYEEHDRRHLLFQKLLDRQERMAQATSKPVSEYFIEFCRNWFFVIDEINDDHHGDPSDDVQPQQLALSSSSDEDDDDDQSSSSDSSSNNGERREQRPRSQPLACIRETGLPCKEDLDKLLSWAFFGVDVANFTHEWQHRELQKMYQMVKDRHGMEPGPRTKQKLQPAQLTIEPLDPRYRPLATYILFFICRQLMLLINRCCGFQHLTTSTGLSYWYRPAKKQSPSQQHPQHHHKRRGIETKQQQKLPLLFFHGIAPAGCAFYIPFMMWGLAWAKDNDDDNSVEDRPVFFFENPAVAFALTSKAPNEQETVDGVWEAVDKHLGKTTEVSIIGHSFGTCLQTYMIHSSQAHRVRQLVLIDPVSIMLSGKSNTESRVLMVPQSHRQSDL